MRLRRVLFLSISSALAAASSVSLSDFQSIPDDADVSHTCEILYDSSIPNCDEDDFSNGNSCSNSCMRGVQITSTEIIAACANADVSSDSLLGIALAGDLLDTLCPNAVTSTSTTEKSTSTTSTKKSTTTTSSKPTTATTTTEEHTSTTTTEKTSTTPTSTKATTSTSSTTESSSEKTSTVVTSTTTSVTETSGTSTATVVETSDTASKSSSTSSKTSSAKPSQTSDNSALAQQIAASEDSGGGSPFDIFAGGANVRSSCSNILLYSVSSSAFFFLFWL